MNIFDWISSRLSQRGMASWLYKRGLAKAKKRDHQGAIADYTSTIGMRVMPPDVLAMVLYHRALVFLAIGDDRKGRDDLSAVLAMGESLVNVKTMARQKLAVMESLADKHGTRRAEPNANPRRETC
jgi:hypothetical protein